MNFGPSRGSLWRKWDLHVHTPASLLNNQFPNRNGERDWEAYASALEASDLAVVAVTDYFTIDGYQRLKAMQVAGRLQGITMLPSIEFRLDQLVVVRPDTPGIRLNLHVIFAEDVPPEHIEEHFLHDLHFTAQGNPQAAHEQLKLKRSNLEEFGETLRRDHVKFQDRSALEVGATQAVVSLKEIAEILSGASRFRGKYVIVLPEAGSSEISWDGQDHGVRKTLLQAADLVFSSNPKTRTWCLGEPPYMEGRDAFVQEFRSLKACIHGSDAHDLATIGKPCARRGVKGHDCATGRDCEMRHCWIKADPTFEGLRQLLYEPGARVRCQADDPTPVQSPHSIASFEIHRVDVSPELTLAGATLHLNPQLVAVVGGRGGGKTALVDLIGNCYVDRSQSSDPNSFVRRIAGEEPAVEVTLTLANGEAFSKEVVDGSLYDNSELVYIAQGELESQVTDTAALTAQIDSMILESGAVADTVKRYDLEQAAKRIDDLTRQLESRNKEVVRLEGSAAPLIRTNTETAIKKKQSAIEDIAKKIEAARARLLPERAVEAEKQQQEIAQLRDTAQKQELLKQLLAEADEVIRESTTQMGTVISEINDQLRALGKKDPLPPFHYLGTERLAALLDEVKRESAATAKTIEQQSKDLAGLAGEQEALARTLDQKKKAEGELQTLQEELRAIAKAEEQLLAAKGARAGTLRALASGVLDRRQKYADLIALFSANKDRLLNDLEFSAEVSFDEEELRARAEELVDGRSVRLRAQKGSPGALDRYLECARSLFTATPPDIDAFVTEAERLLDELRTKLKDARAKNPLGVHELLFRNYFAFKPSVLYKRLPLSKLSLGQKATVLIKIHLADGSVPIIIDSHDDHLDNEFIMDELVEGIRQAKEYRQVILVSNNGNVVVNSDAEQVIVAERSGTTISYETGALEDPAMRERLVKVLEGGREAFSQRGRKYRLQR